jgi:hypothetical protein
MSNYVSEEQVASILRVEEYAKQETSVERVRESSNYAVFRF